jgi:diaminopimelate decarboxylase
MKTRYEPPQIIRHERDIGNKFGAAPGRRVFDQIDGVPIADLVAKHGSPLFVFSERDLRARAREMREAFSRRWPALRLAWSYKTNHLDAICNLFHQEGWIAEVVSGAEYAMARRLGIPGHDIVFNGACKRESDLRLASVEGALIQLDHFDELEVLDQITHDREEPLSVGIRVNMKVEAIGLAWDRFGFNLENGEAMDAARRIAETRGMRLTALHCHLGTYILEPGAYRESARRLAVLAQEIESATGASIESLDLGGGFPSKNSLYGQYGTADDNVPPVADFADAIGEELNDIYRGEKKPTLILESGRALVDEAGTLVATVMGARRLPGAWRGLVLDAGVNLLYTATWYRHDILPVEEVRGQLEETTLFGPLCMAIDVIRRGVPLPPLEAGHRVAIRPVGAYNVTQWMQFSQMRPACVMVCEDGTVEVIRRAETIEDLKTVERLPERFYRKE